MASEPIVDDIALNKATPDHDIHTADDANEVAETLARLGSSSADEHVTNNSALEVNDDEDDYDPESALAVTEPVEALPTGSETVGADLSSTPDSETESNYEPELPLETEDPITTAQESSEEHAKSHADNDNENTESNSPDSEITDALVQSTSEVNSGNDKSQSCGDSATKEKDSPASDSDDDYDPEKGLLPGSPADRAPCLPPKPTEQPEQAEHVPIANLKEAYDAVMQSEVVRLELFSQLSKEKQMEVIQELLREKHIALPGTQSIREINEPQNSSNLTVSSTGQMSSQRDSDNSKDSRPDIMLPMTDQEIQAYEQFLVTESEFLNSKEELPEDSRLFVGNLATNLVKKEDLFRIFSRYGELVEISLKTGYGFAQFKTPEACAACKNGETGKPLHNRLMRLDSSHKRKNAQGPTETGGRGRERSANDDSEGSDSKRARVNVEDVHVVSTEKSSDVLVNTFEQALQKDHLTHKLKQIGNEDPSEEIRDAAYLGVLGACVVKDTKVDLQIFEETGDGGVKFDEYLDIEPSAACELIAGAKRSRVQRRETMARLSSSKRTDRSQRFRQSAKNANAGFQDDRRRNFPERPPRFHQNERDGRDIHGWQRNNGHQGQSRSNWDQNMPRDNGYNSFSGNSGNFYQGRGSGYGSGLNYQQPGYDNGQFGPDRFRLNGRNQNQGYNHNGYHSNRGHPDNQHQNFGGPSQGGPMHYSGLMAQQYSSSQPAPADPALVQTLQNLDPTTMRSVVALLQQQNGPPAPQPGAPSFQAPPAYQNSAQTSTYQQSSPSAQVNSLLAQIQSQPPPLATPFQTTYPQQPQQPYSSASQQQGQPNQALMDMLSRLEGQ
ncbi:hypothetical protein METBIDRAFT_13368 [Metschnikowia bicuspidata var. bicuspidata NRRL YB-4993]|uniref:RRM domain-containing protein n=1 Tax=Metschnikowia bicuspidata var. bicuspidata NRRL YB-4993 TaxID=869754 RepID=A0A1A0H6T5_9ASCO|nr:hypothetical protein METBIDRAFT_13368 [Metschnikowia bicuspidata var. bicuspidata NRRL YB-4993]OBA19622.1 hypothetical protein METBIDRAFT_13368 [Metschnikowia bicuspidata var. bicuspidata NRRL YB-4993]